MSEEEIERLRNELSELEDESYKELRRQMDLLAADETMDDAQKEAFYAKIREELAEMTKHRDVIARKLQKTNELIDGQPCRDGRDGEGYPASRGHSAGAYPGGVFCRLRRPTRRLTIGKSRKRISRRASRFISCFGCSSSAVLRASCWKRSIA